MQLFLRLCTRVSMIVIIDQAKFNESLFSELIELVLDKIPDSNISIQEREMNGSRHHVLRLNPTKIIEKVRQTLSIYQSSTAYHSHHLQENEHLETERIYAQDTVAANYQYSANPFLSADEPFLAYVLYVDNDSQCLYLQPDVHISIMQTFTDELE